MSLTSDMRRALLPAGLTATETVALFCALEQLLETAPHTSHLQPVDIPCLSASGHAFILTLHLLAGRIHRFEVDHDPDLESPAWRAYAAKRAEWEAEETDWTDGAA
ncbi:MAG: hypothetical protein M0P31_19285 [Solirubrobacteraceae bacterium]|nr:hypothetical protein [Solirubrobacteraceae bacterium]